MAVKQVLNNLAPSKFKLKLNKVGTNFHSTAQLFEAALKRFYEKLFSLESSEA